MRITRLIWPCVAATVAATACKKSESGAGMDTARGADSTSAAATSLAGGPYAYVSNEDGNNVSVIDMRTDSVVATLDAGQRPRGIRLMPDGKTLVVAVSGSPKGGPGVDESTLPPPDRSKDGIALVDLETKQVRRLPGGFDPENFDITPDGKTIYVANEDASATTVIDVPSGTVRATIKVGGEPEGVTMRPGGEEVWVTSEENHKLFVIDTKTDSVTHEIDVGKRPRSIAFTKDGKRAYAPAEVDGTLTVIDATTYKPIKTVKVPGEGAKPMGTAISPDDSKVYVSTGRGGTVAVFDSKTNSFVDTVRVGSRPWGIAVTPDGKELWTANGPPANDVSLVDLDSHQVIKRIPVGKAPWGVAISE